MRIAILVEGKTEKAFLPILREYLVPKLQGQMPNLNPVVYNGRIPKEQKLQRTVQNLLSGSNPHDAVIALTDVYTGTNDFMTAQDAKRKMSDWVGPNPHFYPHVALHDFEAWLIPHWNKILQLAKFHQNLPAGNPETINRNKPPSKVIAEVFERGDCRNSYSKQRDARRVLSGQDLTPSINTCAELKAFVNRIIILSGGQPIA